MKALSIITSSVFISTCITAQVTSPDYKKSLPPVTTADLATTIAQPKAKLIGLSSLGKVYAMPTDNMPCLVPISPIENSSMDFLTPLPESNMPNAIPKQQFFTSPPVTTNLFKLNKAPKATSKNLMLDLIRKK